MNFITYFDISRYCSEQSHESFRRYYIHHEDYEMRFKKNSVRFRDIQKSA